MRHRAGIQTILTRTSRRTIGDDLLLVLDHSVRVLVISPLHRQPFLRPFAWRHTNDSGLDVGFTHSLLLQPDSLATDPRVCADVIASASSTGHLQADVSIEHQFSRIFPCSPSVTRVGATPAPSGNCAALLFRLSENLFGKSPHRTRTKRFSEPSEKAPLGLGSGTHSRRFAQECPEGNPGKYTKEK